MFMLYFGGHVEQSDSVAGVFRHPKSCFGNASTLKDHARHHHFGPNSVGRTLRSSQGIDCTSINTK